MKKVLVALSLILATPVYAQERLPAVLPTPENVMSEKFEALPTTKEYFISCAIKMGSTGGDITVEDAKYLWEQTLTDGLTGPLSRWEDRFEAEAKRRSGIRCRLDAYDYQSKLDRHKESVAAHEEWKRNEPTVYDAPVVRHNTYRD